MMKKLSLRSQSKSPTIASTPEGDAWHHDIMTYLGNINVGFAVLAGIRLYSSFSPTNANAAPELDILALTVLGVANASQAWANFGGLRKTGRWIMGTGFDRITVLDGLFGAIDGAIVLAFLLK